MTLAIALPALLGPATGSASAAGDPSAAALTRACPGAQHLPRGPATARRRMRCVVNAVRRTHGLRRLRDDRRLRRAATTQARRCARAARLGHDVGGNLRQRVRRVGYLRGVRRYTVAEALGTGTGRRGSPLSTVRAWLRSSGHRAIVLDRDARHGGFGYVGRPAGGSGDGATWALIVGRRS